jgi:hypothetical protein
VGSKEVSVRAFVHKKHAFYGCRLCGNTADDIGRARNFVLAHSATRYGRVDSLAPRPRKKRI